MARYLLHVETPTKAIAAGSGLAPLLLGLVVLIGWYTHSTALIQVSPAFVPMQYNTALGFLVCGIGLVAATQAATTLTRICGAVALLISGLTLVEYVFGIDLGIDQLLMDHYITVETSNPGRMAPNTALCFALAGLALLAAPQSARSAPTLIGVAILGALVTGLGIIAFSGYALALETAYGWGKLTRMAVHTSAGFIVLGGGLVAFAWANTVATPSRLPNWLPAVVGIIVLTVTASLWQALSAVEALGIAQYFVVVFGIVLALALSFTIHLLDLSRRRAFVAIEANQRLESEMVERRRAQDELSQMSKVFMDATDPILIEDLNGVILDMNRETERAYGWSRDELTGKPIKTIVPADRFDQADDLLTRCKAGEDVRNIEGLRVNKSGKVIPVLLTLSLLRSDDGTPLAVATLAKDITAQKRAEQTLEAYRDHLEDLVDQRTAALEAASADLKLALDNMSDGLFRLDPELNYVLFNERYRELLEIPDEIVHPGGSFFDALKYQSTRGDFGADGTDATIRRLVADYRSGAPTLYEREMYNGNILEFRRAPVPDGGVVALISDVTERKVAERNLTRALAIIQESVEYASQIQRSMLPPNDELARCLGDHFVIWEPRDVVGGDIYWLRKCQNGHILVVGDCTGHGVPGAFVTLIVNGALNRALFEHFDGDPAVLLARMNSYVKSVLRQDTADGTTDDGMELAICRFEHGARELTFAGARFSLWRAGGGEVTEIKGDKSAIGYRRADPDFRFTNHTISLDGGVACYLASDGLVDQVGGEKRRCFGKRRLTRVLHDVQDHPMSEQRSAVLEAFTAYQGSEARRDDMTVVGFRRR